MDSRDCKSMLIIYNILLDFDLPSAIISHPHIRVNHYPQDLCFKSSTSRQWNQGGWYSYYILASPLYNTSPTSKIIQPTSN